MFAKAKPSIEEIRARLGNLLKAAKEVNIKVDPNKALVRSLFEVSKEVFLHAKNLVQHNNPDVAQKLLIRYFENLVESDMKLLISSFTSSEHNAFTFYSWFRDVAEEAPANFWLQLCERSFPAFSNLVILVYLAREKAKRGGFIVD